MIQMERAVCVLAVTYESMSSSTTMSQINLWVHCNYGHFYILGVFYSNFIQTLFLSFLYEGYKLSWKLLFKCFLNLFSNKKKNGILSISWKVDMRFSKQWRYSLIFKLLSGGQGWGVLRGPKNFSNTLF